MEHIDNLVEVKNNEVVFKTFGTFFVTPIQEKFLSKFNQGSAFRFIAGPDNKITELSPYNEKSNYKSFSYSPLKFDIDKERLKVEVRLGLIKLLVDKLDLKNEEDLNKIFLYYDTIYSKVFLNKKVQKESVDTNDHN